MKDKIRTVYSAAQAARWFEKHRKPVRCEEAHHPHTRRICNSIESAKKFFEYMAAGPKNTCEIHQYMHCGLCLKELPKDMSPREWAQLEVGWTPHGIQVWCKRHECNVVHLDFGGSQCKANMTIHQRDDLGV